MHFTIVLRRRDREKAKSHAARTNLHRAANITGKVPGISRSIPNRRELQRPLSRKVPVNSRSLVVANRQRKRENAPPVRATDPASVPPVVRAVARSGARSHELSTDRERAGPVVPPGNRWPVPSLGRSSHRSLDRALVASFEPPGHRSSGRWTARTDYRCIARAVERSRGGALALPVDRELGRATAGATVQAVARSPGRPTQRSEGILSDSRHRATVK